MQAHSEGRRGPDSAALEVGRLSERLAKTVVIGHELPLIREGLVRLCESRGEFAVVAHYSSGSAALQGILKLEPDIGVLDLDLSDLFALEIVRQIRVAGIKSRIVILATRNDRKTVLEALRGGANAYVLKSGPPSDLFEAFHQALSGGVYVSPPIEMSTVINGSSRPAETDPIESLSAREYQVYSLLVDGVRAKEIAARLELSPKTVDTYRASLMRKLDIYDVAGLVRFAIKREMTASNPEKDQSACSVG
jgi:DNA-binding NarL/FixJ family response regulator